MTLKVGEPPPTGFYIKTDAQVKKCLGHFVYWDEVGDGYHMLHQDVLTAVKGSRLMLRGKSVLRSSLLNLRSFRYGGLFPPQPAKNQLVYKKKKRV